MKNLVIILAFFLLNSCTSDSKNSNSLGEQLIQSKPLNLKENNLKGEWKLKSTSYLPIKLPNFNGEYEDLTLKFQEDRKALFYLNNLKDSIAIYEWEAHDSTISILNGDLFTTLDILYQNDSTLSFSFFKVVTDTLVFKRL